MPQPPYAANQQSLACQVWVWEDSNEHLQRVLTLQGIGVDLSRAEEPDMYKEFPVKLRSRVIVLLSVLLTSLIGVAQDSKPSFKALLTPYVEKHELAGAVALVLDKEKVLAVEAVGFADICQGRAMRPDTMF